MCTEEDQCHYVIGIVGSDEYHTMSWSDGYINKFAPCRSTTSACQHILHSYCLQSFQDFVSFATISLEPADHLLP